MQSAPRSWTSLTSAIACNSWSLPELYQPINVVDNGISNIPDEVDKLFTRFHRGTSTLTYNYEGTGIGLYTTKMIIDKFGGTIKVQSILGAGSRFTIVLPYA